MPDEQTLDQSVQQAIQDANQAVQAAKQVAQQIADAASQLQRQVVNATLTAAPQEVGAEREFEIGKDEAWYANVKRTYDEMQGVSLDHTRNLNQLTFQAAQNAIETANMFSKRAVDHADLASDHQWNVDEQSVLTAKSGVQADAMVNLLAKAIADALNASKA